MFRSNTTDFILAPLSNVLSEAIEAMVVVNDGMYGYQLADWVMPTVFLRMTGAQEQKFKCICWDFWTLDLEWRNQRYGKKIAEMSCYDEKNHLCRDLIQYLIRSKRGFDPVASIDREGLIRDAYQETVSICQDSLLKDWFSDSFAVFEEVVPAFKKDYFVVWNSQKNTYKDLFIEELYDAYEALYYHRNRCAHNSTSFQDNLPKFEVLSGSNAIYENYFVRFYLLILLDKLFVQLYRWMLETTDF